MTSKISKCSTTRSLDVLDDEGKVVENAEPTLESLKFDVEAPQYDSFDEFISAAGGQEPGLKFINGACATAAVNSARATARAHTGTAEEAQKAGQAAAAGYKPSGDTRGPSKKAKLDDFEAIMARIKRGDMPSNEELLAISDKY